jgi:diaminopimelate epimerase
MNFVKYQATGNDFILLDNRAHWFDKSNYLLINKLCDRKFGIGADGLILLELEEKADFRMVYFNADGHEGSMCGNGGRCIAAFASELLDLRPEIQFIAFDGPHSANILQHSGNDFRIRLSMKDVFLPEIVAGDLILDTGSPHYVRFVNQLGETDVLTAGREIRYAGRFAASGINVNFVELLEPGKIMVRTYERGVENETLSCGTGVTASAIAAFAADLTEQTSIEVKTPGGVLKVSFEPGPDCFRQVSLEGEAVKVFEGSI